MDLVQVGRMVDKCKAQWPMQAMILYWPNTHVYELDFKFHTLPIFLGTLQGNIWKWKEYVFTHTNVHVNTYKFPLWTCIHVAILFQFHLFLCKVPNEMGRLWNIKYGTPTLAQNRNPMSKIKSPLLWTLKSGAPRKIIAPC